MNNYVNKSIAYDYWEKDQMEYDKRLNQTITNELVDGMEGQEIKEDDQMVEQERQENQGWIEQNIMDKE